MPQNKYTSNKHFYFTYLEKLHLLMVEVLAVIQLLYN